MPGASLLCWPCWSHCWTETPSWAMGGRWPRSLPQSAPPSHVPIPAFAPSRIPSSPKAASSYCAVPSLREVPSSSGRLHRVPLWTHRGPAVVFDYHTAQVRTQDPDLHASPDSVIVLRNAGPVGAPGMPEVDFVPIPAVLRKAGITELVCVTDGRMSGTEGGATALHVTPEAAVGGPIGLVRDGDEIVLDATTGRLDLLVEDRELARRVTEARPNASAARRGYERLYLDHVLQADQGCDFDFLVDRA